jgi:hypothetical protein
MVEMVMAMKMIKCSIGEKRRGRRWKQAKGRAIS